MTQLIIDNFALPESIKGGYRAWEEDLTVELVMLAGNMVKELRGTVWRISYQYGYFNEADKARVIAACQKGRREPVVCTFLPPGSDETITSEFFVTSFQSPKFMWSRDERPLWGDFAVELREVTPHD